MGIAIMRALHALAGVALVIAMAARHVQCVSVAEDGMDGDESIDLDYPASPYDSMGENEQDLLRDLGEGAGCGITMCHTGFYLTSPDSAACSCEECKTCGGDEYELAGGCTQPNGSATENTRCQPCTQCESGRFASTQCTAKADAQCSDCQSCCPTSSDAGTISICKAETSACDPMADRVCANPTDWIGKVTTGSGSMTCGTQCGADTSTTYTSNSTWNFDIRDADNNALFTGAPNVQGPCPAVGCTSTVGFSTEPGTSTGKKPTKVTITGAAGADDSWCMSKFCISSAGAGVKFEGDMNGADGFPLSKWMNPGSAGACGGDQTSWTLNLVGPTAGSC